VTVLSESEVVWHVIEIKSANKNRPQKQLKATEECFIDSATPVAEIKLDDLWGAAFRVVWRG